MRCLALAALALLILPTAAEAELPYPTVDFQGDWVVSGNDGEVMRATMRYRADGNSMRIEMRHQGMAMTSVMHIAAGEAIMWSDQMPDMAMRVAVPIDHNIEPERTTETRTVNGETCSVWQAPQGEACLTEENIPIEGSGEGFTVRIENLQRTAQDPALFRAPDGAQVMDMPMDIPGMMQDMLPGGLGLPF